MKGSDISMLTGALSLAVEAHHNQVDKLGAPYIAHVLAVTAEVAATGVRVEVVAAAALHDVVEDSDVSLDDLFGWGLSYATVDLVEALTHLPGEPRKVYMERIIAAGPDAVLIKRADIRHNMGRLNQLPADEVRYRLGRKYTVDLIRLQRAYPEGTTHDR